MTDRAMADLQLCLRPPSRAADSLAHVELTWFQQRIENWIRFGRHTAERIVDRRRRTLSYPPGSIFAFARWSANDFGTVSSRIDIVRVVAPGEAYTTVPFVRPGGELLLKAESWSRVAKVLHAIDAVETLGFDPADVAPDHWRHVHNRISAGHQPRDYSIERHRAWSLRREIQP